MLSKKISTNLVANIHEAFLKCTPKMEQIRFVHHHKELEQPGGHLRFIGVHRSNRHKANRNTHVNERKFAKLRGRKRLLIELDDHIERREMDKLPPDQLRLYMLRKGKPNIYENIEPRKWEERQMTFQSHVSIVEPYIPPEDSLLTRIRTDKSEVLGDIKDYWQTKWKSMMGYGEKRIRKKQGMEKFSSAEFPKEAEQIYISTFQALANREKRKMLGLVTELAFMKLWPIVEEGTLCWEFVRFIEPSRVLSVRVVDMPLNTGNDIAQVTVRFHSMQKQALYDRFGHLLSGSEEEPREVLEYVVFENHIASEFGKWRYRDKIYPHWLKPKQPINRPHLIEEDKAERKAPYEPQRLHSGTDEHIKKRKEAEENQKNEN